MANIRTDIREDDFNMVEQWIRKDPTRWTAGVMAGIFAGLVGIAVGMVLSIMGGHEIWFPIKVAALPFLGNSATQEGMHIGAIAVGLIAFEVFASFWGVLYSHFTLTNRVRPLLAVGLVWGLFTWIFWGNLYLESFFDFRFAHIPSGAIFAVCLAYGFSLSSVSFFDRMLRGNR